DPRLHLRDQVIVIPGRRYDNQTVDPPRAQAQRQLLLPHRVGVRRASEQQEPVLPGYLFNPPAQRGALLVTPVVRDVADRPRPAGAQQPGALIPPETELLDRP